MAETRYCYVCHIKKGKDVRMIYDSGRSIYGTYVCPECGYAVDKKTSGDTGEKYA